MFLVLSTQGMFHDESLKDITSAGDDQATKEKTVSENTNNLWSITWDKLSTSVPHLKTELFPAKSAVDVPLMGSSATTVAPNTKGEVEKEKVNLGVTVETLNEEHVKGDKES